MVENMCYLRLSINFLITLFFLPCFDFQANLPCSLPRNVQGLWFSREDGDNVLTTITGTSISNRGQCVDILNRFQSNLTIVAKPKNRNCYYCVRIFVRTLNILQKIETACLDLSRGVSPNVSTVCPSFDLGQGLVTLFAKDYKSKNCKSSIEGVWYFDFRRKDTSDIFCSAPGANITACQNAGSQFYVINQQFYMHYKKCTGMDETFDSSVQYECLGDWHIGKNHYFAVVNIRESRIEEMYRCFLKNRDNHNFIAKSITGECSTLEGAQDGPELLKLIDAKRNEVKSRCKLPDNFTGEWVDAQDLDASVKISTNQINITLNSAQSRVDTERYICHERRGNRFVMARLGIRGCQTDFICFEFVPRHHSLLRYRKGKAYIKDDFHTVCSWNAFDSVDEWKYDLMIKKDPVPVRCPIAGKFRFTQKGEVPFVTRIRGGVTKAPRPGVYCKENVSDYSVCDANQQQLSIDANYCVSVDQHGLPVDIYSEPDFLMNCVGYYKENLKSYLITYDPNDAFTRHRCWVYRRMDLNRVVLSQSLGPYCDIKQDVYSYNYTEGAAISLEMLEYEREHDNCPMHFNDGANPWIDDIQTILEFRGKSACLQESLITLIAMFCIYYLISR